MTMHSAVSFDHDTIYDHDGISGFVPNLMMSHSPFSADWLVHSQAGWLAGSQAGRQAGRQVSRQTEDRQAVGRLEAG